MESSIRKFLPKHIKPATERHQGMCGCTICVIFKDMYKNLHHWRLKQISRKDGEISNIPGTTRSKTVLQLAQKRYTRTIMRNDRQYPEQFWDAAATCACEKVEINKEGEEKGGLFHKFLCVMGECKNCPKWEDITNLLKRESEVPIRYNVWARHGSCSVHKERSICPCSNDAVGCLLCDAMDQAERDKQKANFKWKYLRVQKQS